MLKETTWLPETCGCVFVYTWDTDQPENLREHKFPRCLKRCEEEAHQLDDDERLYFTVAEENHQKNQILAIAQDVKSEVQPAHYRWRFDSKRILTVSFLGISLTGKEKNQIKQRAKQQFKDKVILAL